MLAISWLQSMHMRNRQTQLLKRNLTSKQSEQARQWQKRKPTKRPALQLVTASKNILQQMLFMQQQQQKSTAAAAAEQQKSMAAAAAEAQRQQMAFMQNMQVLAEESARRVAALEAKVQPWQGTPRQRQSSNRNDGVSGKTELPTQNAGGDPKQEQSKRQLPSLNLSSVQNYSIADDEAEEDEVE
jgi:hypothetical protein